MAGPRTEVFATPQKRNADDMAPCGVSVPAVWRDTGLRGWPYAASLRGRSRTDFVRDAAVRAAEDVLMETMPVPTSPAGFKAFMPALSGPAISGPELLTAACHGAPRSNDPSLRHDFLNLG